MMVLMRLSTVMTLKMMRVYSVIQAVSLVNRVPHDGLDEAVYCNDHKDDEGVFCYTSGKFN